MTHNRMPADTARLSFRRWSAQDLPLAQLLWGDPQVSRYIGGPLSEEQVQRRFARHLEFEKLAGVQYWQLWLRGGDVSSDGFVGCCGLRPPEAGSYEHGFYLRPQFQDLGLGYEAASAVLGHAFEKLGAASVWGGHHPDNAASKALLLKLGMHYSHIEELQPPRPPNLVYVNRPGFSGGYIYEENVAMGKANPRYSPEFKDRAVRLVLESHG
ncbi:GNAT family N-acetyltransferase, partial [bacterium]|nr:GNAT family N-acetyltransferase [bacterium]